MLSNVWKGRNVPKWTQTVDRSRKTKHLVKGVKEWGIERGSWIKSRKNNGWKGGSRQKEIPACCSSSFNLNATDIKFTTLPHYMPHRGLLLQEMCLPMERDGTTAPEREGSTNRGSWRTGFVFGGGSVLLVPLPLSFTPVHRKKKNKFMIYIRKM